MNSRIYSRVLTTQNHTVRTETINDRGFNVQAISPRFGKDGTTVTIKFDNAPNFTLNLDGRDARTLYRTLHRHYENIGTV